MNWYRKLITNLEYLCKILIHHNPRACWNHYIRAHLWSKFNWLVGRSGSIFCRDISDLWSVYNTNSCVEVPQDSKKKLVTYWANMTNKSIHYSVLDREHLQFVTYTTIHYTLGYQHFFKILRHFNTWIGIVDWSQISNISEKYWSTTTHKPVEFTS